MATSSEKRAIRDMILERYEDQNGRNVMFRRDGSVVVTIDGPEGSSQIYAGYDEDLIQEI